MKKIISHMAALAAVACLWGCAKLEEKLLYVQPIGKNTTAAFLSTMDGIQMASEGMHRQVLEFYHDSFIKYAEVPADLLNVNSLYLDEGDRLLYNYQLESDHVSTYPRNVWVGGWDIVTAANNLINYADKAKATYTTAANQALLDKIVAQAYFCRALAHFDLCRAYGQPYSYKPDHSQLGVPVVTRALTLSDHPYRETVGKVYEQVVSDLNSALERFEASAQANPSAASSNVQKDAISDPYHVSYIACEALLARVCLYMEDWQQAAKHAKSVMDKVSLSPRSEYVDMFRSSQENKGRESIFRLNCYGVTFALAKDFDPTGTNGFFPDASLQEYYEADDIRRELLTYTAAAGDPEAYQGKSWPAVCKYLYYKSISETERRVCDLFVLRVSEMYLIHAEALAHGEGSLSDAADDIAALQARARGIEKDAVKLDYGSAEDLLGIIAKERVRELCFEGHRFFDLGRRGESVIRSSTSNAENTDEFSALRLDYPNYRFVLPIDRMELQSNLEMKPNPGYVSYDGTYIDGEE